MYVESPGPHNSSQVPFVKFRLANRENTGDIHRLSKWVFSVSSYILVLRQEAMENFVFPDAIKIISENV